METRDCIVVPARVDPTELGYLNSIIDAYDDIAVLRTVDHRLGLVEFWVAPDYFEDFRAIADDLEQQVDFQVRWTAVGPSVDSDDDAP